MSAENNKELVRRMWEDVWSEGNLDAMETYFASDFVLYDPPTGGNMNRARFKEVVRVIRGGFPDLRGRIDPILAEGDLVACRLVSSGTHTREYFGLGPTGKKVNLTEIYIHRIRDGKIIESWFESFGQGFSYQLAGKPAPVAAPVT
jgi:steroid delta-isomerase-like uncharacterized protein